MHADTRVEASQHIIKRDAPSSWKSLLDRPDRKIALAGRTVRVLAEPADEVAGELRRAGLAASVRSVPATLDETMVVIGT